jgi:phage anti-repressor protein
MSEMTSLNIVDLIEKNPITRLSNNYQNRLLSKIKTKFNTEDQQLFVASFYSYLNFNSKTDFVINLDNVWSWLGFSHKHKAKLMLEKNFTINVDYKNLLNQLVEQDSYEKKHGGHNKETFMLTINAFKKFCLKADTKKANQIHEYYMKLEETLHEIVNEESNELKLQVEQIKTQAQKNDQQNKTIIDNLTKQKTLEKHNILLREFGYAGALVYIIRVKSYENGQYIVKIGESRRGIEARYNEHKSKYEEAIILDCFLVKRSKDFETFLHNHSEIKLNMVKDLPGHETERELFLIGKDLSYGVITTVIKKNINQFNDLDHDEILNKIEGLYTLLANQQQNTQVSENINTQQLLENQKLLIEKIAILENTITTLEKTNKEILEKLNGAQTRTTTGFEQPLPTLGPRLQKINPDTLQLIKTYETVSECMREDQKMKRPTIEKAIQENTIYNGFRWAYVDRQLDPNTIYNLPPTKQTKVQALGYIAKLDADKTQIINVYLDRKTAAVQNGYQPSSLDNPVRNGTITNGHFYCLYDKCSQELRDNFSTPNPILYKDGVGQFDNQNNLLQEFVCKYDCIKTLHMSDKTLAKALDKNVSYNGYYYKSLGSKLQCIISQ